MCGMPLPFIIPSQSTNPPHMLAETTIVSAVRNLTLNGSTGICKIYYIWLQKISVYLYLLQTLMHVANFEIYILKLI